MKITKPLDNILNTDAKTRILRFLCRTGAEWNGTQIAKEVGITPAAAHKSLSDLNKEGVLLLRNMGKAHVYSLNTDSFIVLNLLKPLFAKEDTVLENIIHAIKRKAYRSGIKNTIISMALYGSVNVRNDRPTSDIDLLIIAKNARVKTKIERLFDKIDQNISKTYGNTLAPYINTKAEFKAKHRKNMPVIRNILKAHTLIYGEKLEKIL
ncbi:nucleotidyltransferase domain-containing protein [Candidatus Omnitrophota bacterium]